MSLRQLLVPAGELRGCVEHAQCTRVVAKELSTQRKRLLTELLCQLVDETLEEEQILRCIDGAPCTERHPRIPAGVGDAGVRERVGLTGHAADRRISVEAADLRSQRGDARVLCNRCAQANRCGRSIEAVLSIFLSRPDQLDGHAHFARDECCLHAVVDLQAPAEPAAELRRVNRHDGLVEAELLRDGRTQLRLHLSRHPELCTPVANERGAVHRLHRRVRKKRRLVSALDDAASFRQYGLALLAQLSLVLTFGDVHLAGFTRERTQALGDLSRVDARHRARSPDGFQLAQRLLRDPEAIGHDDDSVLHLEHATHAAMTHRRFLIDRFQRALEHG